MTPSWLGFSNPVRIGANCTTWRDSHFQIISVQLVCGASQAWHWFQPHGYKMLASLCVPLYLFCLPFISQAPDWSLSSSNRNPPMVQDPIKLQITLFDFKELLLTSSWWLTLGWGWRQTRLFGNIWNDFMCDRKLGIQISVPCLHLKLKLNHFLVE